LTAEQKTNLAVELAGYISQLRALKPPKDGFVGSLGLGPCYDTRLGARRFGPFENIADFHRFVRRGDDMDLWAFSEEVMKVHSRSNSYVIHFSHGDISPENIIVNNGKITALIDWEAAGWFPEYWDYTKLYYGCPPYRKDFSSEMDKVMTTYTKELAAEKPLMLEYDIWSYDVNRPRRSVDEETWKQ
jgi:serine/threonine protein kinase